MTSVTMPRRPVTTVSAGVPWGIYVFIGALWIILGWIVLRFDSTSVGTISLLAGLFVLGAAVFEFLHAAAAPDWRWLHVLLGIIFAAFAIVILVNPGASFVWIAAFVAFYALLAGFFNIIIALATARQNDAWWLLLIVGIIEMAVGFWASHSWARSATLLILLVGALALVRGVTEIVTGFGLRRLQHDLAALERAQAEERLIMGGTEATGTGQSAPGGAARTPDRNQPGSMVNPGTTGRGRYGDATPDTGPEAGRTGPESGHRTGPENRHRHGA